MNFTLPFLNRNISFAREIKEKVGVGSSYLDRRRRLHNENVRHYRYTLYNIIRGYGYFFHSPLFVQFRLLWGNKSFVVALQASCSTCTSIL